MGLFRRNKNIKKPVIRQIIDLVPRWMIESCTKKHKSDKGCRVIFLLTYLICVTKS